jgi:hypothetical protein
LRLAAAIAAPLARSRSSAAKKGPGSDFLCVIFFVVFFYSPHRETPKNVIKQNREKIGLGFLVELFVKDFVTVFFANLFCSAFELPSQKNTRKRDKPKKNRFFGRNFGKSFRHGRFAKTFLWCF